MNEIFNNFFFFIVITDFNACLNLSILAKVVLLGYFDAELSSEGSWACTIAHYVLPLFLLRFL